MTKLDQNNSVPATQTINYAIVFLGGATQYTEHTASVSSLQSCLDAALTQAGPNKLLSQYYGGSTVSATSFTVIAHPTPAIGSTGSLTESTNRMVSNTDARLAFAVLTTERKAA